jgi:hypothetical protein
MMFMDGVLASMGFLLCAGLLYLRRRWAGRRQKAPAEDFSRLAEVVKDAEVANQGFFRALELVQKNLAALIARAESTEQRLGALMLHPGIDRREQYTAAALLLAEGQDVEWVASMLNLPRAQVHLIRDLQQVTAGEKRIGAPPRLSEEPAAAATERASNDAAPREKTAARPILLVEATRNDATIPLAAQAQLTNLKGGNVLTG